jgi:hypothetical protein
MNLPPNSRIKNVTGRIVRALIDRVDMLRSSNLCPSLGASPGFLNKERSGVFGGYDRPL